MTELFFRDGSLATEAGTPDAKGRSSKARRDPCGRCGGAGGADVWKFTGWTCFQCGGVGFFEKLYPIYTQARLDKLVATAEKKAAKRAERYAAAQARAVAEREAELVVFKAANSDLFKALAKHPDNGFLADLLDRATRFATLSERQIEAAWDAIGREEAKASTVYIGEIGERLDLQVTIERVTGYETQWGWTSVVTMRDAAGNAIVSKGSFSAQVGDELSIRATVKDHSPYNGEKQTVVQRVTVKEAKT